MVEERIYALEDISIAISKTKDKKQTNRISKDYGTTIRGMIHAYWEYQKEKRKGNKKYLK